ncbi:MAG TPA: nitroreductase/quinone reductase family protein [Nitrososphaeraceae archaeon]|jgi:hypothetical protein
MSKANLRHRLASAYEITLSVKGRKSGKDIARPVWFSYEGNTLYLLPVQGSDTNWYKNLLANPSLKISIDDVETLTRGRILKEIHMVDEIVRKFRSKYGEGDMKKYYTKFDVAVEVVL